MRMLIKGARLLDPGRVDGVGDILIEEGTISGVFLAGQGAGPQAGLFSPFEVLDAAGLVAAPGLIDMHVHLREPGQEYKETIETGVKAAAAGGFTAVCCMPNTQPVNDNPQVTSYIVNTAKRLGSVRVYPVAAISRGSEGRELSEYFDLKEAGAIGVSDDGLPVADARFMRRALEYAGAAGLLVISHCEETSLSQGVMNEGALATRLGLAGIPNAAESIMVMRDIALCELTGRPVHIAHVSTRQSVRAIRAAKAEGIPVTAETAPHYFTLTDAAVAAYNTNAKMNPPLRSEADREAVIQGLCDGTLDAIATDHAPHSVLEKDLEFDSAANGVIGLETSLPLGLRLVHEGRLTLSRLISLMATNPARILGLRRGIEKGAPGDITLMDIDRPHVYHARDGFSKSRNTPFDGWEFKGGAVCVIVGGRVIRHRGGDPS